MTIYLPVFRASLKLGHFKGHSVNSHALAFFEPTKPELNTPPTTHGSITKCESNF